MCLQRRNDLIVYGLKAAGVTEVVTKANEIFHKTENPFIIYRNE